MPPKNTHAFSKPAITSSSFWLYVGHTKQRREYYSTMISAHTTLRRPQLRFLMNLRNYASTLTRTEATTHCYTNASTVTCAKDCRDIRALSWETSE